MTTIEAVKRAYAVVMLNAAREAATRIRAAERRAAALAGGMAAARDDAVAALLRLKAISDAKIKEAKLQSLAHVKKIQELEMQLHSAQSTIVSLGELERAHTELNQTRTIAKENRIGLSTAQKPDDSKMSSHHSKIHVRDRSKSTVSSDLASSGVTHKESECYCSRGTKHTSSPEQHFQSVETPLGRSAGKADQVKNLSISGKKGIGKKSCSIEAEVLQTENLTYCKRRRSKRSGSIYKHAINKVQRKTEHEGPDTSDSNGCMLLLRALEHGLSPLKIFDRQGGNHSADLMEGLHMARKETLNMCSSNSGMRNTLQAKVIQMRKGKRSKNVLQHGGFSSRGAMKSARSPLKEINGNMLNARRLSSVTVDGHFDDAWGLGVPRHPLGQHATEAMMYLTDPMQSLFDSDNISLQTVEPKKNGTEDEGTIVKRSIHPDVLSSVKDAYLGALNMPGDLSECRTRENNTSDKKEDKNHHICNLDLDKFDVAPVVSSSTDEENVTMSSGSSNLTAGIQCIRYTFNRRKRKSEHIENSTDDSVSDKRIHLMGPVEEHDSQTKSQTQVILTESPKSNRRLLEVARQLISLSEK